MTVRLDTFKQVAEAAHPKDANLLAAQTAGEMIEMGCFAKEFTVYGSAYYEEGQRRYIISADEAKIADFIQDAAHAELLPTPLSQLSVSAVVPAGEQEAVSRAVKVRLARQLAASYPLAYFQLAAEILTVTPNDQAEKWLKAMQEELEGVYEEERLQLFEGLLQYACYKKNVTPLVGHQMRQWLARMRREMADDGRPTERFVKTFYGFIYFKEDGSRAQDINVCREVIYRHRSQWRQMEMTPVVAKTYWYNQNQTVQDLRAQFASHLDEVFDEGYLTIWRALSAIAPAVAPAQWQRACQQAEEAFGPEAQEALREIGRRLGL